jgi:dipeptidyl aminopeptidase/acylaminoacyl peptidase
LSIRKSGIDADIRGLDAFGLRSDRLSARSDRSVIFACSALAMSGLLSKGEADELAGKRPFTVRDSVEMSYFGTVRSSEPDDMDDDGIVSPDGRYVVKLTHRGVLPQGVTEGTIWLFATDSIKRSINDPKISPAKPVPLAHMSAAVNGGLGLGVLDAGNTIIEPRWAEDSHSLTFLGRNERINRQLFRVDLDTRKVTVLTPPTQDVISYAGSGNSLAYLAGADADLQAERAWVSVGPGIPDVTIGTGIPLMPLLYPHFNGNAFGEPVGLELWQVRDDHAAPVIDSRTHTVLRIVTKYTAIAIALSPDGTRLVTIAEENHSDADRKPMDAATSKRTLQYHVINLRSGTDEAWLNLRVVESQWGVTGRYRAVWSPDGTGIALTETMLRLDPGTTNGLRRCAIAVVNVSTRAARCIAVPDGHIPGSIYALNWMPSAEQIHVRYKKFDKAVYTDEILRHRKSEWIASKVPASHVEPSLQLFVHETLNEPPVLIAADAVSGKSRQILDPNPQFADIALGTVSVYEWTDSHGRKSRGGLVKPPDYAPGRRYALVIQTHGFDQSRFFRAGYSDTSNAGRALAGRGLLVLQVQEPRSNLDQTWHDGTELGMDVYLAAVDQLTAEGIVDPTKVGISGYSYSGWLVATSITRAPDRFAAAEIANSDPVTLTGYYEYVDTPLAKADADGYVGARPYGEGLKSWIERAPSFSTDKIRAPVLFQAADPWHLIGLWDMYAAMRDQGKPVELQYMRSGEHNIRKPLQVLVHQEMIVDWFDFWLNGHEDSNSAKAEQYARWRKLQEAPEVSEKSATH